MAGPLLQGLSGGSGQGGILPAAQAMQKPQMPMQQAPTQMQDMSGVLGSLGTGMPQMAGALPPTGGSGGFLGKMLGSPQQGMMQKEGGEGTVSESTDGPELDISRFKLPPATPTPPAAFIPGVKKQDFSLQSIRNEEAKYTGSFGDLSARYESNGGYGAISNSAKDPGGASYGKYQLAAKPGTLTAFLRSTGYINAFAGMSPGSSEFNSTWKSLSGDPKFQQAQEHFIEKNHFDPVRLHADKLGVPNTYAVNNVLFSMGVQHGSANKILDRAGVTKDDSQTDVINKLYSARVDYVKGIKMDSGIKKAVLNRYVAERQNALDMINIKA